MKRLWAYLAQQSAPAERTNEGAGGAAAPPRPDEPAATEDDESIDIAGFSEGEEGADDDGVYPDDAGDDDDEDDEGGDLSDLSSGEEAILQNELQLVTRELAFIHNLRNPLPPTVVRAVPAPPQPSNGMSFVKRRRSGSSTGLESPSLASPPIALTASGHLEPEWHYFSPLPVVFPLATTVAHHQACNSIAVLDNQTLFAATEEAVVRVQRKSVRSAASDVEGGLSPDSEGGLLPSAEQLVVTREYVLPQILSMDTIDGRYLALGTMNSSLAVCDLVLPRGHTKHMSFYPVRSWVNGVRFRKVDEQVYLAVALQGQESLVLKYPGFQLVYRAEFPQPQNCASLSPDGKWLLSIGDGPLLYVLALDGSRKVELPFKGGQYCDWNSLGSIFSATSDYSRCAHVWDLSTDVVASWGATAEARKCYGLKFSPNNPDILLYTEEHSLVAVHLQTMKEQRYFTRAPITGLGFSPDDRRIYLSTTRELFVFTVLEVPVASLKDTVAAFIRANVDKMPHGRAGLAAAHLPGDLLEFVYPRGMPTAPPAPPAPAEDATKTSSEEAKQPAAEELKAREFLHWSTLLAGLKTTSDELLADGAEQRGETSNDTEADTRTQQQQPSSPAWPALLPPPPPPPPDNMC